MKVSIAIIITLAFAANSASALLDSASASISSDSNEVVRYASTHQSEGAHRPLSHANKP